MATALHFSGVKTPCPASASSERSLQYKQPLWSQRLRFATCVASNNGFYTSAKKISCTSRVLRVSCEGGGITDVLEKKQTDNQCLGENEKQLTCVMKFGGSSVASAERMREVADLILSFPQERPVIVLSAMGKTTNKLLLVRIIYDYYSICVQLFILYQYQHVVKLFVHWVGRRKGCQLRCY